MADSEDMASASESGPVETRRARLGTGGGRYAALAVFWFLVSLVWLIDLDRGHPDRSSLELYGGWGLLTTAGLLLVWGLFRSVREAHRTARLLAENEERWKNALEGASQAVWDWNVPTGEVFFSVSWKAMLGYEPHEIGTTVAEWESRVHPEDLERVMAEVKRHLNGETPSYSSEHRLRCKDGSYKWVLDRGRIMARAPDGKPTRVLGTHSDIDERKRMEAELLRSERYQALSAEVLRILNDPRRRENATATILRAIQRGTGLQAVGIRLQRDGHFPYVATEGFSSQFVAKENDLRARGCDGQVQFDPEGKPRLECTCGMVLSGGRPGTGDSWMTPEGSVWTNRSEAVAAIPADQDPRLHPRNRCIHEGYRSVALIPIRAHGEIVGILQMNDRRPDCFALETIRYFEGLAASVGVALLRLQEEEALREAEQRYRGLFENALEGIFQAGPDGTLLDANPALARLLGFATVEELAPSAREYLVELSEADGLREGFLRAIREHGFVRDFEAELRRRDGGRIWVTSNVWVVRGASGDVVRFEGMVADITERKRSETVLRERVELQDQLAKVATTVPGMIYSFRLRPDGTACLPFCTPVIEDYWGLKPEEVREDFGPAFARGHPDDLPRVLAGIQESAKNLTPWHDTFRVVHPRKGELWLTGRSLPSREPDGSTLWHGFIQDVTEHRRLEERVQQAQRLEAVGQLAGGVAHDFNNILAATMMHLGLLQMNPDLDAETRQALSEMEDEARRAATLTKQLLMFGRRSVMALKPVDLSAVITHLMKMLARVIGENVTLHVECPSGLPLVEADAGMLEQVVVNLVVNARDAMPKGGRVTLRTSRVERRDEQAPGAGGRRAGCFVCLTVSDTGHGMDAETRKRIFEPFFTTKDVGKGTGLGLATVHGIVAQHRGWVEVESEPDRGATFRVFLPTTEAAVPASPGDARADPPGPGQGTILVVEDDAMVRAMVSKTLRRLGYRVFEASNGQEALAIWRAEEASVDLLLTDMVMPEGITGLDLAKRLKAGKPGLKVIVSSGYSSEIAHTGISDRPGFRYLPKPYEVETLSACVRAELSAPNLT